MSTANRSYSVKDTHESHDLFGVSGTRGHLAYLTNGVPGQHIALIGVEVGMQGSTINNGTGEPLWFIPSLRQNIRLPGSQAAVLKCDDTLFLLKGPDHYWYAVGLSDN